MADPLKTKARKTWIGMKERCYSEKSHANHPTYTDVTVCEEWQEFDAYYSWFLDNYITGYHLDKDLKVLDSKEYSPTTCTFVPRWLNNILLDSASSRGIYPIGVSVDRGRFKARFSCNGESVYLGCFDTVNQASRAYQKAKGQYLIDKANSYGVPAAIQNNLIKLGNDLIGED